MKITYCLLIAFLLSISILGTSCQKQTDYSPRINALQARIDSLASALIATNANLQTTNNNLNGLIGTVTAIQAQLAVIVGQISTLNTQLTATNNTVSGLSTSISNIQSQITTILGQIATLNSQMTVSNNAIGVLSTSIDTIQSRLSVVVNQVAVLNSQQTVTNVSLAEINAQLIVSNTQLNNLQIEFNTLVAQLGIVNDIDGNSYHSVIIGTQVWMVENLKTTKFRNGDPIPYFTQSYDRGYCWYNDDIANKDPYGAIYNYYTATDIRGICPLGWHVPSIAEWTTLINYLGGNSIAGGKLKEAGTAHWLSPNTGATNESGFTALPGGAKDCSSNFVLMGTQCKFWTSEPAVTGGVYAVTIYQTNTQLTIGQVFDCNNYPVRCIKD